MTFDEVHRTIKRGDLELLRAELESGLNPSLANQYSWTILMLAAMHGNTPMGRLLIEKGADPDTRNKFGDTALSLAVHSGHPSFVKMLLASGASMECDPDGKSLDVFLNWVGQYSVNSEEQMANIKQLFDEQRKSRVKRNTEILASPE